MAVKLGYTLDPSTDSGYDLWLIAGQSNAVGTNDGAVAVIDVTDPDVASFGYTGTYANVLTAAVEPLAHQHRQNNGIGPGLTFAKWMKQLVPRQRKVLLVPAAYDGSKLVDTNAPTWNPNTAGSYYANSVGAMQRALAAAGPNARYGGVLWLQGESESLASGSASSYQTVFDQLIDGYRSVLGNANLPFVVMGMPPEDVYLNGTGSTWVGIAQVHANTPTRKAYTAYTAGPAGYGYGDNLHYNATGARILGRRAANAYTLAFRNASRPAVFTFAVEPLISGSPTVGSVLTANAAFSNTPDTTTYQWYRSGAAISGATSATYTLIAADNGNTISVTVAGTKSTFGTQTLASPPTATVTTSNTVNATDNFNRTSTTSLGTTTTGSLTWAALTGTWGTDGTRAYNVSGTGAGLAVVDAGTGKSDHTAQVTFPVLDSGTALIVRCTDASNWTCLLVDTSGNFAIYRNNNGSVGYVNFSGTTTSAAGDTFKIVMSGSTGTVSRNGTQVGTFTDSYTGTKSGLRSDSSTGRFDDYSLTA